MDILFVAFHLKARDGRVAGVGRRPVVLAAAHGLLVLQVAERIGTYTPVRA